MENALPRLFEVTLSSNPTEREKEWCELLASAYHNRIVESGEYYIIKKLVDEKNDGALHEMLYGVGDRVNAQVSLKSAGQNAVLRAKFECIAPYTHEQFMEVKP